MNGGPLPVEHGFPVRTIVPGLYGFVSATKWVVDMEVTRFDRIEAYWTGKGWAEQAPVRLGLADRRPALGRRTCRPGEVRVGGVAWAQHIGIERRRGRLDGGAWTAVELGRAADRRHLGAVGGTVDARARRPRAAGAGDRAQAARCRPASSATSCPTAPPAGTRSTFTAEEA